MLDNDRLRTSLSSQALRYCSGLSALSETEQRQVLELIKSLLSEQTSLHKPSSKEIESFLSDKEIATELQLAVRNFFVKRDFDEISILLNEFLDSLLAEGVSEKTLRNYRSDILQFVKASQVETLDQLLSPEVLDAFIQAQNSKGLKHSSISRKVSSITRLATWASEQNISESDLSWLTREKYDIERVISQETEDRLPSTEDRRQETDYQNQSSEIGSRKSIIPELLDSITTEQVSHRKHNINLSTGEIKSVREPIDLFEEARAESQKADEAHEVARLQRGQMKYLQRAQVFQTAAIVLTLVFLFNLSAIGNFLAPHFSLENPNSVASRISKVAEKPLAWLGFGQEKAIKLAHSTSNFGQILGAREDLQNSKLIFRIPTNLAAATQIFDLSVDENLSVAGDTELTGDLTVDGTSTFNGLTNIEGTTQINGDQTVTGTSTFTGPVTVNNTLVITGDITADGVDLDLGDGELTASNVIYEIKGGDGISVSGDQEVTITLDDDVGAANLDLFSSVTADGTKINASGNDDELIFEATDTITLSTSGNTITIGNNAAAIAPWLDNGTTVTLNDITDLVGIGTNNPEVGLHIGSNSPSSVTAGDDVYISGDLEVEGSIYGSLSITGLDVGFSQGSVLFTDSSEVITADPSNFLWDDTNKYLGLSTNNPNSTLDIGGGNRSSIDGIDDLLVADDIEVDGNTYLDGDLLVNGYSLFVNSSTNRVGIGVTNPNTALHVSGEVTFATLSPGATDTVLTHSNGVLETRTIDSRVWGSNSLVDSTGTTNYIPLFTDSDSVENSLLYQTGGQIGLGTTSPSDTLTVVGSGNFSGDLTVDSGTFFVDSGNNYVGLGTTSPGALLDVAGIGYIRGSNGQIGLYVNSSGHVGIGNSSQLTALHVGTGTADTVSGADAAYVSGDLEVDGTIYGTIAGTVNPGLTEGSVIFIDGAGNLSEDNDYFYWDNSNKYLGLGTSSPSSMLTVTGTAQIGGTSGQTGFVVNESGYVGIGVTNPTVGLVLGTGTISNATDANDAYIAGDLEVAGTIYANVTGQVNVGYTEGSVLFTDSSGNIIADYNNFYWDNSSKYLGIGTSSPGSELEVAGTITGTSFTDGTLSITGGTIDLGTTTTIADANFTGDWDYNSGNISGIADIDANTGTIGTLDGTSLTYNTASLGNLSFIGNTIAATNDSGIYFLDNAGNGLYLEDGGQVGIGVSSPDYKLHVAGDGYYSSNLTVDGDLTVDGNSFYVNSSNGYVGLGTTNPNYQVDINANASSGTIFNFGYQTNTTVTGDLTGAIFNLDDGYVIANNQNVTGLQIKLPTVNNTQATTKKLQGFYVDFGTGSGIENSGSGTTIYNAAEFALPSLTETSGELEVNGLAITLPQSISGDGTVSGLKISGYNDQGVASGDYYGLNIEGITAGSGNEVALQLGTGWDAVLQLGNTEVINGAGITTVAGGGTGLSTYSQGDLIYANADDSLARLPIGTTSNYVLTVGAGGVPQWGVISGSTCSNCLISDPSSSQFIAPTGDSTGLIIRQTTEASPTADIFAITDSSGSVKYFYVDSDGNINTGTGSIASDSLTLTPQTDKTALTLNGTNVLTSTLSDLNANNTQGTIFDIDYIAAQTLAGDLIAMNIDLSELTPDNYDLTGQKITIPSISSSGASDYYYYGYQVAPEVGGTLTDSGGGSTSYAGYDVTLPSMTQSVGTTVESSGFRVTTPTTITTGGTANGLLVNPSGVGAGYLYGVNIDDIVASTGTETAFRIGSGWDYGLYSETSTNYISQNLGIGTTNPDAKLHVSGGDIYVAGDSGYNFNNPSSDEDLYVEGNLEVDGSIYANITGTITIGDTEGAVLFMDSGGDIDSDVSNFYWDNSSKYLGLGTTAPSYKLDILGSDDFLANFQSSDALAGIQLTDISDTAYLLTQDSVLSLGFDNSLSANNLNITSGGSVGIGTTNPSYLFSVGANSLFGINSSGYALLPNGLASTPSLSFTGDTNTGLYLSGADELSISVGGNQAFSVSSAKITSYLPHEFTSAGDVSMQYDLIFSNQTGSAIESYGPLRIVSGESFESNNLTLTTYNSGNLVADIGGYFDIASTLPAIRFQPGVSGDTDFWLGVVDDEDGDDDDYFAIGDGTSPGSSAFLSIGTTGLVGLGDTTPGANLVVGADTTRGYADGSGDVYIQNDLEVDGTIYGNISGSISTSLSEGSVVFADSSGTLSEDNDNFFWDNSNKYLGIGTTDPLYQLHVDGTIISTGSIRFFTTNGLSHRAALQRDGVDTLSLGSTSLWNGISFQPGGPEAMRILSGGNVGIGTASPDYKLEISSAAASDSSLGLSDGDVVHGMTTIAQTDSYAKLAPLSSTAGGLQLSAMSDTDAQALSIRGIIGSSNPTDSIPAIKLVGARSDGGTGIQDLANAETLFQVANNDNNAALTILGNGNVGIGTTSPSSKLHIEGTSDQVQQIIEANATQNDNLTEWQDSSGNVLSGVDERGIIFSNGGTDSSNFFAGDDAGNTTMTGSHNNALGYASLQQNTTGGYNNALGYESLRQNTTGNHNNALGYKSLQQNTTGSYNNALGYLSLYQNTTGNYNNALGRQSLQQNTTGSHNNALGRQSLQWSQTGSGNLALGAYSFGQGTGAVFTGADYNTIVGYGAGYNLGSDSDQNVMLGYQAGYNETGSNKLYISNSSSQNLIHGDFSTGQLSLGGTDATSAPGVFIKSDGNVGIGTTSPTAKLQIDTTTADTTGLIIKTTDNDATNNLTEWQDSDGNVLSGVDGRGILFSSGGTNSKNLFIGENAGNVNATAQINTGIGSGSLQGLTSGFNNTALGANTLLLLENGGSNIAIGVNSLKSVVSGSKNVAIGINSLRDTTGSNNVAIGSDAGLLSTGSSNVLIGYNAGSQLTTESDQLYIENSNSSSPLIWGDFSTDTLGFNGNVGIGTTSPAAKLQIDTTTADTTGLIIKTTDGVATNNLTEWQDSSGNVLSGVDERGIIFSNGGTDSSNFFAGDDAGNTTMTGSSNNALGLYSLTQNTTGSYNNALGSQSLQQNTIGNNNNALGYRSLNQNTTGSYNNALGYESLYQNTTGSYNNALGYGSLQQNTTGNYNNALGRQSLQQNTTGSHNNALGRQSLQQNTTGSYNNALGYGSLYQNTTGSYNNALGHSAGKWSQTGSGNLALGAYSFGEGTGAVFTGADYNTIVGYEAGYNLGSDSDQNVMLGYQAGYNETGSNKLYISNSSSQNLIHGDFSTGQLSLGGTDATSAPGVFIKSDGNVGIGTDSPTAKLTSIGQMDITNQIAAGTTAENESVIRTGGPNTKGLVVKGTNYSTGGTDRWVAVGYGTNTIAYSSDGINWTGLGDSIFSTRGYGVAWNGSMWVAVGEGGNSIAYSSDGINWTGLGTSIFSTQGRGVAWNGSMWVAVGDGGNTIAYSSDGINWTGLGDSIFSTWGYGVAWNGSMWVAVGGGTNTIAYSSDGINWTGLGDSIFSTYGLGVASAPAPNMYPSVGQQGGTTTRQLANLWELQDGDGVTLSVFDKDGKLGVGTGSPAKKLHISSINGDQLRLSHDLNNYFDFSVQSDGSLRLGQDGSGEQFSFKDGKLGVGTTSPSTKLHVLGTSTQLRLAYDANNWANFTVGSNSTLSIGITGTTALSVGSAKITSHIPHEFASAGDVSIAYDLNFSNPTSSYINSDAPLYLVAGENFNSSDLTLRTYNKGNVIVDSEAFSVDGSATVSGTLAVGTTAQTVNTLNVGGNTVIGDGYVTAGNTAPSNGLLVEGNVGIGISNPSSALHVVAAAGANIATFADTNGGTCSLSSGGIITCSSDRELKKNFEEIDDSALDKILALNPSKYNWKKEADGEEKQAGFIAQEVEEVFPDLVRDGVNGYKSLNTIGMIPYLTQAIQEQHSLLTNLDSRFSTLEQSTIDIQQLNNEQFNNLAIELTDLEDRFSILDSQLSNIQYLVSDIQYQISNYSNLGDTSAISFISNESTGSEADVLSLQLGAETVGSNNAFVSFKNGASEIIGAITGNDTGGVTYSTAGADFAEYFPKVDPDEALIPGDVVCLHALGGVKKCSENNTDIVGVVSSKAGFVGNSDKADSPNYVLVGVLGQLPVKVSPDSESFEPGDSLTADIDGSVRKAKSTGHILGKALEEYEKREFPNGAPLPQVSVYVNPGFYMGDLTANGELNSIQQSTFNNQPMTDDQQLITKLQESVDQVLEESDESSVLTRLEDKIGILEKQVNELNDKLAESELPKQKTLLADQEITNNSQVLGASVDLANTASETIIDPLLETQAGKLVSLFSDLGGSLYLSKSLQIGVLTLGGETGNQINSATTLEIQPYATAGVELVAGQVSIDENGNVSIAGDIEVSGAVSTKKLQINNGANDESEETLGSSSIPAGETVVAVPAGGLTKSSKIFTSLTSSAGGQSLVVQTNTANEVCNLESRIENRESNWCDTLGLIQPEALEALEATNTPYFLVTIDEPLETGITFDWWIVDLVETRNQKTETRSEIQIDQVLELGTSEASDESLVILNEASGTSEAERSL